MPEGSVFTLVVRVGRRAGDGLPAGATGAALLCYLAARDQAEAVREAVAVLRGAGLAPLEVAGHGSLEQRLAEGGVAADERGPIERARAENAVIVAEVTPESGTPGPPEPGVTPRPPRATPRPPRARSRG